VSSGGRDLNFFPRAMPVSAVCCSSSYGVSGKAVFSFSFVQRQAEIRASGLAVNFSHAVYRSFSVRQGFTSSAMNRENIVGCRPSGSGAASSRTTRASSGRR